MFEKYNRHKSDLKNYLPTDCNLNGILTYAKQ